MGKRKLGRQYKKLIDYVNVRSVNYLDYLGDLLPDVINQKSGMIADIKDDLDVTNNHSDEFDQLIAIVIDIYFGNYEYIESEYYWKLKTENDDLENLYASHYDHGDKIVLTSSPLSDDRMTQSILTKDLGISDYGLSVDSFSPVKELRKS